MTPSCRKIHAPIAIFAMLAVQACSPTRPPIDELDAASRGLGSARAADAPVFAPDEYRAAGVHFDQAQAAESSHDYDVAAQFARESAADSELARVKAQRGKLREAVEKLKQDNATLDRDLTEHASTEPQP